MQTHTQVLVTGATGFVGRWLVLELSKRGKQVGACMRRAAARETEYLAWLKAKGGREELVTCLDFTLESEQNPWQGDAFSAVEVVYHTAANFRFGLSREEALGVNVDGGTRLLSWTSTLPQLRRFVMLGGYRLASPGLRYLKSVKELGPKQIDKLFAQHGAYEASKLIEYVTLRTEATRLGIPWSVVHPSTVIGDAKTGETIQFKAFAASVKELYEGKTPVLLGSAHVFLPLISVDYVASFLASLPEYPASEGQEYCLLDQDTPKLHALMRLIGEHMGVSTPRLRLPIWCLKLLPKAILGENKEGLTFLTEEAYDTSAADQLAAQMGLAKPAILPALQRWLDFLVSAQFGESPHGATNAIYSLQESSTSASV